MKKSLINLHYFYPIFIFGLNCLSLLLGIAYLFIGKMNLLWNIYGFLMLITFLVNIIFNAREEKQKGLSYLYLVLSALWMLVILLINTAVSMDPQNKSSQSTLSAILIFSLFFLGGLIAFHSVMNKKNEETKSSLDKEIPRRKGARAARNAVIVILSGILYSGLFLAINILRKEKTGLIEVFLAHYAIFYAIAFLSIGLLIVKLLDRKKYYIYYFIVSLVTTYMFFVFLYPLFSTYSLVKDAKNNYMEAFPESSENNSTFNSAYFRQLPFSLPEYFFGTPSGGYQILDNIPFYHGTEGVDKGLELSFDVYMPTKDADQLPGGNSVLIRIHGGGWTSGDKGAQNFAQVNKYFAAQGYIVFDIQYGLNDQITWLNFTPIPESISGDYSIDDMVRHIGIFTDYLAEHADEYHANLNSVFISGGSAGGQLTLASGLAMASGNYQEILNPKLKIKGLIPFYPANGLSTVFDIGGEEELVEPSLLVDKNSPPCLVFQGTHDGLVSPFIAQEFHQAYLKAGNEKCALLEMPYAGHAGDIYFPGYYNQVFIYYMERFLYTYR